MIRSIIGGAAAAALLAGPGHAAPAVRTPSPPRAMAPGPFSVIWIVTPGETGCRVDLDLVARSGAVTPVSLTSDGQMVSLRFFRDALPPRAFLPIRINGKPYSNLMLRGDDGAGELVLSEDTEAAMRKGAVLGVAWLTEEPLQAPLAGSERGLSDLRTCGAQAAARHRERAAADQAARDRAAAEARARMLADAQLAAVRAQTAAAEAQRRDIEETAERKRRADADAAAERERQAALDAQARAYRSAGYGDAPARPYADPAGAGRWEDDADDEPRWAPPPRVYYPPRSYAFPRY